MAWPPQRVPVVLGRTPHAKQQGSVSPLRPLRGSQHRPRRAGAGADPRLMGEDREHSLTRSGRGERHEARRWGHRVSETSPAARVTVPAARVTVPATRDSGPC